MEALKDVSANSKRIANKMTEMQNRLEQKSIEGVAGAGMVKVRFNGLRKCSSVEIDPAIANKQAVICDLLRTAINDGLEKVREEETKEQASMAQSMLGELPSMMSDLGIMGSRKPDLK